MHNFMEITQNYLTNKICFYEIIVRNEKKITFYFRKIDNKILKNSREHIEFITTNQPLARAMSRTKVPLPHSH